MRTSRATTDGGVDLAAIYRDPRFWRLAPLSATCIGASWALQGLWVAPWLTEVERLGRTDVARQLLVIALALSASGLMLGYISDRLQRSGVAVSRIIAGVAATSIAAQIALVLGSPLPAWMPWCLIAGAGTATVLSYARLSELYPKSASGRANGALNVLHFGTAFLLQSGIGVVVDLWPAQAGQYPSASYRAAVGAGALIQLLALLWFLAPRRAHVPQHLAAHPVHHNAVESRLSPDCAWPYWQARRCWTARVLAARAAAAAWRMTSLASAGLCVALSVAVVVVCGRSQALPYFVTIE